MRTRALTTNEKSPSSSIGHANRLSRSSPEAGKAPPPAIRGRPDSKGFMKRKKSTFSLYFTVFLFILFRFSVFCDQKNNSLRIVSLVPSLTESLFDLGMGDSLVGATEFCLYPAEAQKIERVGSMISINSERIVQLRPDFVLALGMNEQKSVMKLERMGVIVHHFESPKNFAEICDQFLKLGQLCHRSDAAQVIVERCRQEKRTIERTTSTLPARTVFIQLGSKPLFAATGSSFTNDYLRFGGGINIAEKSPSGLYSREAVLIADPDLIIIASMGLQTENEKEQWRVFKQLKAVKNNALHVVDAVRYCVPTPKGFVEALRLTADLIHPELREQNRE